MPDRNPYYNPTYADAARNLAQAITGDPAMAAQIARNRSAIRYQDLQSDRQQMENDALSRGLAEALTSGGTDPAQFAAAMPQILATMAQAGINTPANFLTPQWAITGMSQSGASPAEAFVRAGYAGKGAAIPDDLALTPERSDQIRAQEIAGRVRRGGSGSVKPLKSADIEGVLNRALATIPGATGQDQYRRTYIQPGAQQVLDDSQAYEPLRQLVVDTLRETGGDQEAARSAVLQALSFPPGTSFNPEYEFDPPSSITSPGTWFNGQDARPAFVRPGNANEDLAIDLAPLLRAISGPPPSGGTAGNVPFSDTAIEPISLDDLENGYYAPTAGDVNPPAIGLARQLPAEQPALMSKTVPAAAPAAAAPAPKPADNPSDFLAGFKVGFMKENPEAMGSTLEALSYQAPTLNDIVAEPKNEIVQDMSPQGGWLRSMRTLGRIALRQLPDKFTNNPIGDETMRAAGEKVRGMASQDVPQLKNYGIKDVLAGDGIGDKLSRLKTYLAEGLGTSTASMVPPAVGAGLGTIVPTAMGAPQVAAVTGPLGAFAPSYLLNTGPLFDAMKEANAELIKTGQPGYNEKELSDMAVRLGLPIAGLDVVGLEKIMESAAGPAKKAIMREIARKVIAAKGKPEAVKAAVSEVVKAGGKQFVKSGAAEAGTEAAQESLQVVGENAPFGKDVLTPENALRVTDAAIQGFAAGGTTAGGTTIASQAPAAVEAVRRFGGPDTAAPAQPAAAAPAMAPESAPAPAPEAVPVEDISAAQDLEIREAPSAAQPAVSPAAAETQPSPGLTPEAAAIVDFFDAGGVPSTITQNLRRVATENGVDIAPDMTPAAVIDALRTKSAAAPAVDQPAAVPSETAQPAAAAPAADIEPEAPAIVKQRRTRAQASIDNLVRKPLTLRGFVKKNGGVIDAGGELRAQDLHRDPKFRGVISGKGLPMDTMLDKAREAGYFADEDPRKPARLTTDDLIQALIGEANGNDVYSGRDLDQVDQYLNRLKNDNDDPEYVGQLVDKEIEAAGAAGYKLTPEMAKEAMSLTNAGVDPEDAWVHTIERAAVQMEADLAERDGQKPEVEIPFDVADLGQSNAQPADRQPAQKAESNAGRQTGPGQGNARQPDQGAQVENRETGEADAGSAETDIEDDRPRRRAAGGGRGEASAVPASAAENSRGTSTRTPGERMDAPYKQRLLSMRRDLWRAAGIEPDIGENMPAAKQFDVAKTLFKDKYDIDIELDPRADMAAALNNVKDLYVELQTLAALSKLPEKALGLSYLDGVRSDGLKLVFKREREGGALGTYVNDKKSIFLPGRARSLAHEFFHALDYRVMSIMGETADALGKAFRGYTGKIRREGEAFEPGSVQNAFIDLLNALFFDDAFNAAKLMDLEVKIANAKTDKIRAQYEKQADAVRRGKYRAFDHRSEYYQGAKSIPTGGDKGYWVRPTEMGARAYEAWIADRAERAGVKADLIAARPDAYKDTSMFSKAYPQATDQMRIFKAFDALMETLSRAEILAGPDAAPALFPEDKSVADPMRWFKRIPGYQKPKGSVWDALKGSAEENAAARRQSLSMLGLLRDRDRPLNPVSFKTGLNNLLMMLFSAESRRARVIESRYKNNPSPTLSRMVKNLTAKGNRFDALHDMMLDKHMNNLDQVIQKSGLDRSDTRQMKALWDLLIGATDKVPAGMDRTKMVAAAGGLREIMNRVHAELREDYNVDIGYVGDKDVAYIPRVEDLARIDADRETAIRQFTDAYRMKYEDMLDDYATGKDTPPEGFNAEKFDIEEQSEESARALVDSLLIGNGQEPGHIGAPSRFTKNRSFPGRADFVLDKVRVQNPIEAVELYVRGAAKRGPWVKLFSPEDDGFIKSLKQMSREGVKTEDVKAIEDMVYSVAGMEPRRGIHGRAASITQLVRMLLDFGMLARAVVISLGEPGVTALRTGDPRDSFKGFYDNISGIWKRADVRDRNDIMQAFGMISSAHHSLSSLQREGGTFADSPRLNQMSAKFYLNNGLTRLTLWSRHHAITRGGYYYLRLARDITDPAAKPLHKKWATDELKNSGVPANRVDEFTKYVIDRDGALPDIDDAVQPLNHISQIYARVLADFGRDVIQEPRKIDRSWANNSPAGGFLYSYVGFSHRFYEQIAKRAVREVAKRYKEGGAIEGTKALAWNLLAPYALYWAGMTAAFTLRTLLFSRDSFFKLDDDDKVDYLMKGGLLYSLPFGPTADLLVNTMAAFKYSKSMASAFSGKLGYIYDSFDAVAGVFNERNSPKNKKQERKAAEGLYRLIVMPALGAATALAPVGGLLAGVFGAGNMWAGSRDAQKDFSEAVVGYTPEEKAKLAKDKIKK